MTIAVWRFENEYGKGPYNGPNYETWNDYTAVELSYDLTEAHSDDDPGHPVPFYHAWESNHLSGFRTQQDAVAWFDEFIPELNVAGYRLVERQASEIVYEDALQIVFVPAE